MPNRSRIIFLLLSTTIAVRSFQGAPLLWTIARRCLCSTRRPTPSFVRPISSRFLLNTLDPFIAATVSTNGPPTEQPLPAKNVFVDRTKNSSADHEEIYLSDDSEYIRTITEGEFDRIFNGYAEHASIRPSSADHIIRSAWITESLWKQRYVTLNGTTTGHPPITSFTTILKIWSKVAHTLVELHHSSSNQPTNKLSSSATSKILFDTALPMVHVDTSTINIYSAKDVAMHVTNLLNQQQSKDPLPDIHSYNCVIDTWYSICRDHPALSYEQVQDVFQLMNQNDVIPDTFSYNTFIDLVAYCGHLPNKSAWNRLDILHELWDAMKDCPTAQVSVRTINSVMHAYSITIGEYMAIPPQINNVRRPAQWESEISDLLNRAQQILANMKERFAQTKSIHDQPDAISYTNLMECYSRTCSYLPTSIDVVESLFAECKSSQSLSPSIYSYSTILKAWSKTTRLPHAPHRGEELLNEFFASLQPEVVEPSSTMNQKNLTTNIKSISNKNKDALFTAVIECWAKSQESTKAIRALKLLQQMRQRHISPSVSTYNAALKACAKTRGSPEQQTAALKIAFAILKTMEMSPTEASPIHTTFASLLEVVNIGLPMGAEERSTIAKLLFEKAMRGGQVNARVIQNLQASCDASVFQSLLSNTTMFSQNNGSMDYDKIPKEWKRNVRTY
jgi:Pentatricopeptide repeat domain